MKRYPTKYRQTAFYIVILIFVFLLMGFGRRCSRGLDLSLIMHGNSSGDTLDVGTIYGPMSYYLYDDTLGGLNHDLLMRMSRDLGRPVRLWAVSDLPSAIEGLEHGRYDILASLPSDSTVKSRFLTTRSIFLDKMVLILLMDSDGTLSVRSTLELGDDTIRIQQGSPVAARLARLSAETGTPLNIKEENLSEEYLCMKVASGEFPLAVVNEKTAAKMKQRYPRLSYDNPVSLTQFQVWLLNRHDSLLLNSIESWLDSFLNTDEGKALIERYNPD